MERLHESASAAQEKSKEYEYLWTSRDPLYEKLVESNILVMKYIAKNKLILYGGIAIDYSLKLAGAEGIYPENLSATPDLDFFSPDSVNDAYKLADELYANGCKDARAIAAMHIETMKVDCGEKHWVADITYRAKSIFDKLPTLTYRGMLIVHPHFQRIDMHSALSIPYDNPPREVIFNRWAKDLKRFALLEKYYPILPPAAKQGKQVEISLPAGSARMVWTGFNAYALMFQYAAEHGWIPDSGVISATVRAPSGDDFGAFSAPKIASTFDFVSFKAAEDIKKYTDSAPVVYAPHANMIPRTYKTSEICVYDTLGQLISCGEIEYLGLYYRVVNAQYLLRYFLSMSFIASTSEIRDIFKAYYCSLMEIIKLAPAEDSVLGLSIETYGAENESNAKRLANTRTLINIEGGSGPTVQRNYYPSRTKTHPHVDFEAIHYFQDDGRQITE